MKDKTIILSSLNKTSEKAVLNIEKCEDGYKGNLRLYNFKNPPKGILTLGFLVEKEIIKAALSDKGRDLYGFDIKTNCEFSDFTCALVNIQNGNATPLLSGSTDKFGPSDVPYALSKNFDLLDETNLTYDEVQTRLDEAGIDFVESEKTEIESVIDSNFCTADKCSNCSYRNAFYTYPTEQNTKKASQQINFLEPAYPSVENLNFEKKVSQTFQNNFYDEIKGQLSLLFERYPEETFLNEIIPNSKWVKVDYEDNGQYFVIGLLYEENKVGYVCYGMPGEYTVEPPREFSGICQWLPLDPEKPKELGYWLMYQDAETGENVEIKIS